MDLLTDRTEQVSRVGEPRRYSMCEEEEDDADQEEDQEEGGYDAEGEPEEEEVEGVIDEAIRRLNDMKQASYAS